jgi:hypothetical protein
MAQIRRELHEDIQMVVAGAESASDWRHYVRRYPWAALGLTMVVGYLVVPRRRPTSHRIAEETVEDLETFFRKRPRTKPAETDAKAEAKAEKKEKKAGLFGMLFGMLSPIALRAAQSYAAGYVENWIAQQQTHGLGPLGPMAGPGPGAKPGPGVGRPPGPGRPGGMPPTGPR